MLNAIRVVSTLRNFDKLMELDGFVIIEIGFLLLSSLMSLLLFLSMSLCSSSIVPSCEWGSLRSVWG